MGLSLLLEGPASSSAAEFAERRLGFVPDAAQRRMLESGSRRLLLCCSRQWGKSTAAAALTVYRAEETAGALVVCVSPTLRQTGEFLLKVRLFLDAAGVTYRGSKLSLTLGNGSRIVGLPGREANVRGYSAPSLVVIDEAARVEDSLYYALRPMLATSAGSLVLLSTPFGERGFFWKEWAQGGERWTRVEAKATECARIPAEFLEEERAAQGAEWYAQEYLCSFVGMRNQAFRGEWLEAAKREGLRAQALGFRFKESML